MDSLISMVRDLLPDLGAGFVEMCLQHYDFRPDEVINAILENNLAPHLTDLDHNMPRAATTAAGGAAASGPLAKAAHAEWPASRSVFDDDDFDINTRDAIDLSRVHRGKKNKGGDAKKLLDDKRDLGKFLVLV